MKRVTVITNQSLFDLAVQELGAVSNVFDLAVLNEMALTSLLQPGVEIEIPNNTIYKKDDIINYFSNKQIKIATSLVGNEGIEYEGISHWAINKDFIVS